ncbi:MAG TPA: response regulator transcription factor, partial [Oceanospirillales bacterium]|nr:response regulator transcription factor [Oceanospirillales bacterium]
LIVDDEPLALMRLQKMLEHVGITDIVTAKNGQQAVNAVQLYHPHVVILDIEMPVLSGIEAAAIIKQQSPESQIIFCTAYDEFAIKAFDLSASDYLLKPVSRERLLQALKKVNPEQTEVSFSFYQGNDLNSLPLDDIYCFISEEKTTFMHCRLGVVIIDEPLVELESRFHKQLLRINRNALINVSELYGIHREATQAYAKLNNTDYQPQISRRNIAKVKEYLK